MTFQAKQRVVAVHAVPIVGHAHHGDAAALDDDFDGRRAGVEAIFDEFLDHARRPLDHLARRDLAGDDLGQQRDAAHGLVLTSARAKLSTKADPRHHDHLG